MYNKGLSFAMIANQINKGRQGGGWLQYTDNPVVIYIKKKKNKCKCACAGLQIKKIKKICKT